MSIAPAAEIFGMDGLIVVIVVALVLFGSTQIPKLARSLGSAQKEFKKGLADGEESPETPAVPAVAVAPAPVVVAAAPVSVAPVVADTARHG
jgi:sec-independent protein translocase protein TatA